VRGDFDAAMKSSSKPERPGIYPVNSINRFASRDRKQLWELLQDLE
jgi:hypothetical protein